MHHINPITFRPPNDTENRLDAQWRFYLCRSYLFGGPAAHTGSFVGDTELCRSWDLMEASHSFGDAMPGPYLAASGGDTSKDDLLFWHLERWVLILSRTR